MLTVRQSFSSLPTVTHYSKRRSPSPPLSKRQRRWQSRQSTTRTRTRPRRPATETTTATKTAQTEQINEIHMQPSFIQKILQKQTMSFSDLLASVSSFSLISETNGSKKKKRRRTRKTKSKKKVQKSPQKLADTGNTRNDFTPIQLNFIGIRKPKDIHRLVTEFNSKRAKACDLNIIHEESGSDSEDETQTKVDEKFNGDIAQSFQYSSYPNTQRYREQSFVKFQAYWPLYKQLYAYASYVQSNPNGFLDAAAQAAYESQYAVYQDLYRDRDQKAIKKADDEQKADTTADAKVDDADADADADAYDTHAVEDIARIESGDIHYQTFANPNTNTNTNANHKTDHNSDTKNKKRKQQRKTDFIHIEQELFLCTTVGALKDLLYAKYEIPAEYELLLVYSHIVLADNHRTLKYYGIESNSIILLCISDKKRTESEMSCDNNCAPVIAPVPKDIKPVPNQDSNENDNNNNNGPQVSLAAFIQRHVVALADGQHRPARVQAVFDTVADAEDAEAKADEEKEEISAISKFVAKSELVFSQCNQFKLKQMTDLDVFMYERNENCIRMPCGHGMVQTSLYEYCRSELKDNKTVIKCPHVIQVPVDAETRTADEIEHKAPEMKEVKCNQEWKYPIIRRVLLAAAVAESESSHAGAAEAKTAGDDRICPASIEDIMKLELLSARNTVQECYDLQKCGKCLSIIYRPKQKLKDIVFQSVCPLCTAANKSIAIFKFEESMKEYEQHLMRLNQWKVTSFVQDKLNRETLVALHQKTKKVLVASKLVLPTFGMFHRNAIQFYQKETTQLSESEREMDRDFFRTESDSESEDSDIEEHVVNSSTDEEKVVDDYYVTFTLDGYETDVDTEPEPEMESESDASSIATPIMFGGTDSDSDSDSDESVDAVNNNNGVGLPAAVPLLLPIPAVNNNMNVAVVDSDSSSSSSADGNLFGDLDASSSDESSSGSSSDEESYIALYRHSTEDELILSPFLPRYKRSKRIRAWNIAKGIGPADQKAAVNVPVLPVYRAMTDQEILVRRMHRRRRQFYDIELKNEEHCANYAQMYCWGCGCEWQNSDSMACGNPKCSTSYRAQVIAMLSDCATKTIGQVSKVPLYRACPNCCQMIEHWTACKHVQCQSCKKSFCFVCLKLCLDSGWQCGSYTEKCPNAQRQGLECLPSANQTSVKLFSPKAN